MNLLSHYLLNTGWSQNSQRKMLLVIALLVMLCQLFFLDIWAEIAEQLFIILCSDLSGWDLKAFDCIRWPGWLITLCLSHLHIPRDTYDYWSTWHVSCNATIFVKGLIIGRSCEKNTHGCVIMFSVKYGPFFHPVYFNISKYK